MADKEAFLKAAPPRGEVDIPDVGPVGVRGLTRQEALSLRDLVGGPGAIERRIIHLGMTDPALTEAEVEAWYGSAPAGHTDRLVNAISALSGLSEGAEKRGVPEVRGGRKS